VIALWQRQGAGTGKRTGLEGRSERCSGCCWLGRMARALCYGFQGCGRSRFGSTSSPPAISDELGRSTVRSLSTRRSNGSRKQVSRCHGRSAVSIASFANGALGEHRRHDTDGIRLEIEALACRSSVRRSIDPNMRAARNLLGIPWRGKTARFGHCSLDIIDR
jgi:hypothetical protein